MWTGAFFDGHSAAKKEVSVRLDEEGLVLIDEGGVETVWPYPSLRLISAVADGSRVEIGSSEAPAARVRLEGAAIEHALKYKAPQLGRADWKGGLKTTSLIVLGLAALLGFLYFLPSLLVPIIPDSYAARMGNNAAGQVQRFFGGACEAGPGLEALKRLGQSLAASDEYDGPLRIEVIDTPMVNALALPGGRIIFFRGLIEKAESADEIAGVLAHEMGHVEHRHGLASMIRGLGLQTVIGALMGGTTGDLGAFALQMSFSREAEGQADEAAIRILNASRVSAEPFAAFFDRLAGDKSEDRDDDGGILSAGHLLSSHPASDERAALAREKGLSQGAMPSMTDAEWMALKAACKTDDD